MIITFFQMLKLRKHFFYLSKDFVWTNKNFFFLIFSSWKLNTNYVRHIPKLIYEIPRTLGNIVEKCLFQVKLYVQAAQVTILCIISISSNTILSIDKKFGHVNWRNIDSHIFNRVISLKNANHWKDNYVKQLLQTCCLPPKPDTCKVGESHWITLDK